MSDNEQRIGHELTDEQIEYLAFVLNDRDKRYLTYKRDNEDFGEMLEPLVENGYLAAWHNRELSHAAPLPVYDLYPTRLAEKAVKLASRQSTNE